MQRWPDAKPFCDHCTSPAQASSSIGRAPVSKTGGWGFDSLLACQLRSARRSGFVAPRNFGCNGGAGQSVKIARLENVGDGSSGVTAWIGRSRVFLAQVKNEMERVTWPTRKEVYATTLVVILTSVFFGVYLWSIDLVLNRLAGFLFAMFGAQ